MRGLSKSKIIAHRQCPKRLWLQTNCPDLAKESPMARLAMHNGNCIGEAVRTLFPGGLLIDTLDLRDALRQTREALAKDPVRPLFEATFEANGVLVRADVLLPGNQGAELIEVKGSSSIKDYHREDAAIQAWVIRAAGIPVRSIKLAHANRAFRYAGNGDYRELLQKHDITDVVDVQSPEVAAWIAAARITLEGPLPEIAVGSQCREPYDCPFHSYCAGTVGAENTYPIEELYRASAQFKQSLRVAGYTDLRDVPQDLLRSDLQIRIQRAAITGKQHLDASAALVLRRAPYPRYYLDFETILVGRPVWLGTGPGMAIPFQWSCHIEHAPGKIEHREFLAEDGGDPRLPFVESLLAAVGTVGPIYAYHASFERQRLKELAIAFPDIEAQLVAVIARIDDLEALARESYYHPEMRGSWSLKRVLPTVAPDLDYANLSVSDGNLAQEAYLEMFDERTTETRRREIRCHLLEYCGRDTEALLRVAKFLVTADAV